MISTVIVLLPVILVIAWMGEKGSYEVKVTYDEIMVTIWIILVAAFFGLIAAFAAQAIGIS